ncbi:MAG: globin family protein [Planctomycetota bacterium]
MPLNVELLESSFQAVAPKATGLADLFYETLFREHPEVRSLFPESMDVQKKKLVASLSTIVASLRKPEKLESFLHEIGERHVAYGATEAHYPVVGATLLKCLAQIAGPAWTPELEETWATAYSVISETMLSAAKEG